MTTRTPEDIAREIVREHIDWHRNGQPRPKGGFPPEYFADELIGALTAALRAYADERLEEAAKNCATQFDVPPEYETEPMVWHAAWETCSRAAVVAIRALKSRPPKSEDARDDDIAVTLSCGCVFCDLNLTPKYDGSWFHEGPRRIRVPCNKPREPTP